MHKIQLSAEMGKWVEEVTQSYVLNSKALKICIFIRKFSLFIHCGKKKKEFN